ncbi:MAG: hypothetical protein HY978_03760 [Candidatus Liptonbacteria bacterium]|nr:hypothetical protein [Candidatus Liptonbacteria bacterium]
MKHKLSGLLLFALVSVAIPLATAIAQVNSPSGPGTGTGTGGGTPPPLFSSLDAFMNTVVYGALSWLFTFAIIIGVGCILLAAFKYMMARGNPEEVSKAHQILIWSSVGLGVAILAKGVPCIIASFLGATIPNFC